MFQSVRGTHDILPEDMRCQQWLLDIVRRKVSLYGFDEMATPIFEFSGVFHRLGASSDVISKETYTFLDRGGDELTLRPEGTAGVARAVISNGLTQKMPLKFFYTGPMFRYDRPQKGRYRQFDQLGVEFLGVSNPLADVEVIALADSILRELGIHDKVRLELNTIGDHETRASWREALVSWFSSYRNQLSEDSQRRLDQNPLRILDSKDPRDQKIAENAPPLDEYLTSAARDYFKAVCDGLDSAGVPYVRNSHLVRGLDYYCHTAFEFVSDGLAAQGTVLAGGRYDGLIGQLGGPEIPGIGWAGGLERLLLLASPKVNKPETIMMLPLGSEAERRTFEIALLLREKGIRTEMTWSGNMAKRLKRADQAGASRVIILGEDELAEGMATIRDLASGNQEKVAIQTLPAYFMAS